MKQINALQPRTAYKCDIEKNTACRKTGCVSRGGPCMATTDIDYAVRNKWGRPIIAEEEDMQRAAKKAGYYVDASQPKPTA